MVEMTTAEPLKVIVIGAGIGGLVCAIACAREGLNVQVLEQAAQILPVGAGIQIPPNASRVLRSLELLPQIEKTANTITSLKLRRYADGNLLASRPIREDSPWFVIHRADYHEVLLNECKRLGVEIKLNTAARETDIEEGLVHLENGTVIKGDVVVGGDGLWSTTRTTLLGKTSEPFETGDLAYRGTFSLQQLKALNDPRVEKLCRDSAVTVWVGPEKHCVFYPMKSGTSFNMVLLRPDNLPTGARTVEGDIEEMRYTFQGWDEVLTKIISCIPSVLKWKLMHHDELAQWTKGRIVLLGDACHPTLPYQAQGAAMAVEDGAIIGKLLGMLNSVLIKGENPTASKAQSISEVLHLYESLQKHRTTFNVKGAINSRYFYHMVDGSEQQARDDELAKHPWTDETSQYMWCNMQYQAQLLKFDVIKNVEVAFKSWASQHTTNSKGWTAV